LKPLAVYKLSKVEAALRRLDLAVDTLEAAANTNRMSADEKLQQDQVVDASEVVDLRNRCDDLSEALRAASIGVDVTISRLKLMLDN